HEAGFADRPLWQVVALWDGGLVLYGALIGGLVGYFSYAHFVLRKQGVSNWKMLDVIAPSVALGVALGRIGCLFTGCCYGNVACSACPALHFPLASAPTMKMVRLGYQTPLGFQWDPNTREVEAVEPGSAAANAGVRDKDVIVNAFSEMNGDFLPILRLPAVSAPTGPFILSWGGNGERSTP